MKSHQPGQTILEGEQALALSRIYAIASDTVRILQTENPSIIGKLAAALNALVDVKHLARPTKG